MVLLTKNWVSDLALFAALNFSRGNMATAGVSAEPFKYIGPGEFPREFRETSKPVTDFKKIISRVLNTSCPPGEKRPQPLRYADSSESIESQTIDGDHEQATIR